MTFTQQDYEAWLKRLRDPNTKLSRTHYIDTIDDTCRCALGHAFPNMHEWRQVADALETSRFFRQSGYGKFGVLYGHIITMLRDRSTTLPQVADWVEQNARTPDQLAKELA